MARRHERQPDVLQEERPVEQTNLALAEMFIARLREAREVLDRGEEARALRLLDDAVRLKHLLWSRLEPMVRRLASRYARYAESRAGLTQDDLVSEAFLKFGRALRRWDPARGRSVSAWARVVVGRYFCQLARKPWVEQLPGEVEGAAPSRTSWLEIDDAVSKALPDDRQRDQKIRMFRLYWREDWTLAGLAKRFGVSISTVHKRLGEVNDAFASTYEA